MFLPAFCQETSQRHCFKQLFTRRKAGNSVSGGIVKISIEETMPVDN